MKKVITAALLSCTLAYCSSQDSVDSIVMDDSDSGFTSLVVKGVKATTAEVKDGKIKPREVTINKSIADIEKVIDAVEDSCNKDCLYPVANVAKQERIEGFPGVVYIKTDTPLGSETSFLIVTKKTIGNQKEIISRLLDKDTINKIKKIEKYKDYKHNPTFNQILDTQYILTTVSESVTKVQLEISAKGNTFSARLAPTGVVKDALNKSREQVLANLKL